MPVYNGSGFLHKSLGALFNSTFKSYEVIVVDDCSSDDSADIAKKKGVRVLTMARNSGPAAARNMAAKSATGEILLFVDADVVVKADTLEKVAARFAADPEVAALFGSYDDKPYEPNFLSQYKNLQHHFVHQTANSEASTFWAGLGAIRRDTFIAMGGFDCELFRVPSIEDIELGARLRSAGHRILLDKDIQATHLKKWEIVSLIRTDVFSRALPWSRLILTSKGLINDMNLKTNDRLSAGAVALSLVIIPFVFWRPPLILLIVALVLLVAFLNRPILQFFVRKRGLIFAALTFPWLLLYFFYSGTAFIFCWFWYALPQSLGLKTRSEINES